MKISESGIYYDMPAVDYFADPVIDPSLTQSLCKIIIEQSPLHARLAHPRLIRPLESDDERDPYNKAIAIGNVAHSLMIGRGKDIAIIDKKDFRSKEAQTERDAAIQRKQEPILRKHWNIASDMVEAAGDQLEKIHGCEDAFHEKCGSGEIVIVAKENGVWLRAMMDWMRSDWREVWDLKTSGMSASPYNTGKLMASAGWHIQAAMHERILDQIDPAGAGRRKYRYVCQENEPPYALTVNEIGEAAMTIGRKQIDYAIRVWRHCIEHDTWPGYPTRIIMPELPVYSEQSWLNREELEHNLLMAG